MWVHTVCGSLRDAIATVCPSGTITFQPGLTGTITLTTGQLEIDKNVTISGPGVSVITVSGNNASRVFHVQTGKTATISNLTIANGKANFGGGIYNLGNLTISNCTFTNNYAQGGEGGAIDTEGGTVTVVNSTISGNRADTDGGGLLNCGASQTILTNVTITNNHADNDNDSIGAGGGIAQISRGGGRGHGMTAVKAPGVVARIFLI